MYDLVQRKSKQNTVLVCVVLDIFLIFCSEDDDEEFPMIPKDILRKMVIRENELRLCDETQASF